MEIFRTSQSNRYGGGIREVAAVYIIIRGQLGRFQACLSGIWTPSFSNISDYLQSFARAELHFLSHHHSIALSALDEEDEQVAVSHVENAERALQKGLKLCTI
jgi:hypothetical protein